MASIRADRVAFGRRPVVLRPREADGFRRAAAVGPCDLLKNRVSLLT